MRNCPSSWRRRVADEAGFVGGFEALPFGLLVFVVGTLLLANAWAVVDGTLAASAAAREGVRAFVESVEGGLARQEAELAATATLVGHGKDASRMTMHWEPADPPLERCQPVRLEVRYRIPTISMPWVGSFGGGLIETSARHGEIVDPYRSGLGVDGFEAELCSG